MICEKCIHNFVCKYGEARSDGIYCTGEKCKQFQENPEQEIISLLKERAGLKLHCAEYKRKYKALSRIMHREIRLRIEGIKVQYSTLAGRLNRSESDIEKAEIRILLRYLSNERAELQTIYDMCKEVIR